MKKHISFVAMLLLALLALVGCGKSDTEKNDYDKIKADAELTLFDEAGKQVLVKANLAADISAYDILRSDTASESVKKTATRVRTAILEKTGVKAELNTDFGGIKSNAFEIVVGKTKDKTMSDVEASMKESDYAVKSSGNKIYILGGSDEALEKAADIFINYFIYGEGKSLFIPLGDGFSYKKEYRYDKLTINGTDISEYKIAYYGSEVNSDETYLKSKNVANMIRDEIFDKILGANLKVVKFDSLYENDKYILVSAGSTNVNEWTVDTDTDSGNVTISGSYASVEAAANTFLDRFLRAKEGSTEIAVTSEKGTLGYTVPYTKADMLRLFDEVYNTPDKVLSGCHSYGYLGNGSNIKETNEIMLEATGKKTAILELDMGKYSSYNPYHNGVDTLDDETLSKNVSDALEYANDGGIVAVCIHMPNPLQNASDNVFYRGKLGDDDAAREMLTDGTELNAGLRKTLEPTIRLLKSLKENGIPFMFRPLHEMNGNWFWWCVNQGGATLSKQTMVDFWQFFYKLVTEELGIDNAVWVYSPNYNSGSLSDVLYAYPGDEYVDIVGCDWYTSGSYEINSDDSYVKVMSTGKPAALTEVGPGGSLEIKDENEKLIGYNYTCDDLLKDMKRMQKDGYNLTYFMTWTGLGSIAGLEGGRDLMNDDFVMTLDDVAAYWKNKGERR